jgi:hypothetical protein
MGGYNKMKKAIIKNLKKASKRDKDPNLRWYWDKLSKEDQDKCIEWSKKYGIDKYFLGKCYYNGLKGREVGKAQAIKEESIRWASRRKSEYQIAKEKVDNAVNKAIRKFGGRKKMGKMGDRIGEELEK